jgi:hypothetical protein
MFRPTFAVAVVALAPIACSSTSSSSLATNQITPSFSVKVDTDPANPQTFISAVLKQTGTTTDVQLAAGDALTASTDKDASLTLAYDGTLHVYSTTLTKVSDRTTLTFALTRASGTSAPSSTVQLPAPMALTAPAANAQVTYSGGTGMLTLTWSNAISGATMYFFPNPCNGVMASSSVITGPDNGTFTIATSNLVVSAPSAAGECVQIRMERDVTGTVDPAFGAGGTLKVTHYDYVTINVVP